MRRHAIFLWSVAAVIAASGPASAYGAARRPTSFVIKYGITPGPKMTKLTFWCLVPKTRPNRQKILRIDYSHKPARVFEAGGSKYAEFELDPTKGKIDLQIKVAAELYRYDLAVAMQTPASQKPRINPEDLKKLLVEEKGIDFLDPAIQAAAARARASRDPLRAIFDFVLKSMRTAASRRPLGASRALKAGGGGSTDFADVTVALCRAIKIPARVIKGYTLPYTKVATHSWVEIFSPRYGWIPLDPHMAKKGVGTYSNLSRSYVYMSALRNDETLKGGYSSCYSYRGDTATIERGFELLR